MDYEILELTTEQKKAAKKVYAAIRAAHKIGVGFWDNYGTLSAYNSNRITLPVPSNNFHQKGIGVAMDDHNVSYYETLPPMSFNAGNADDPLFYNII